MTESMPVSIRYYTAVRHNSAKISRMAREVHVIIIYCMNYITLLWHLYGISRDVNGPELPCMLNEIN